MFVESVEVESFLLGVIVGATGTVATIAGILAIFFRNIRGDEFDGTNMGSSGGLVMPSFFFVGAQDIFSNVKEQAAESARRFKQTGRFADLYSTIERSQEMALEKSLDALRERFPASATRELVFGFARRAARSSSRAAADLYNFTLRLQRQDQTKEGQGSADVLDELWQLDEARCSVSGRREGVGGRRPWKNLDAEILIDQQVAALRRTVADIAKRPLFARVAPEILARPTNLALVRLFDVFHPGGDAVVGAYPAQDDAKLSDYTEKEVSAIDKFLTEVIRTSVMRRACRHVASLASVDLLEDAWKEILRDIWFHRREGRPSVFEHVFLGNLSEDASGQPIAGGLHSWLKFYLEEARGTATYLGYVYNVNPEDGLRDNRFVSGKFVWDFEGYRLVKDQGGFFVGTSPEWQLACGTVAYFETTTLERAQQHGWEPWPGARGVGYTKDATHGDYVYRHVVCCSAVGSDNIEATPELYTSFATFLGAARQSSQQDSDEEELDRVRSPLDLAQQMPNWLVTEGVAVQEDCELCAACVEFSGARGCRSINEALTELRGAFIFQLEDAIAAANEGFPLVGALVRDTEEVVPLFLAAAGAVTEEAPLSAALPGLLQELKLRGRRGPRLHQPLRLLLTGRAEGPPVADVFRLLELAEKHGGDEAGVKLTDRINLVRELFPPHGGAGSMHNGHSEAHDLEDCEPVAPHRGKLPNLQKTLVVD